MSPPPPFPPDFGSRVDEALRPGLDAAAADGVSVQVRTVAGQPVFSRNQDRPHYAASTMKLPLLIAAHREHERGRLDLDARVPVQNEFRSAQDGSPFSLEQSDDQDDDTWAALRSEVSLRELARHSIVRSGNLATNLLLEQVGVEAVAAVLADAGCSTRTTVRRGIGDAVARRAGRDNLVTASDLGLLMCSVAGRRIATERTCVGIEQVLAAQEHRDQIPAGLPPDTYVANKTGWVDGVAHDVALVRPADRPPYVLAVCTTADLPEQTLYAVNAGISTAVWKEWTS
jgi:beta-lactamase class A